nr:hypothetical protein [Tanacetum cinerariifolium]
MVLRDLPLHRSSSFDQFKVKSSREMLLLSWVRIIGLSPFVVIRNIVTNSIVTNSRVTPSWISSGHCITSRGHLCKLQVISWTVFLDYGCCQKLNDLNHGYNIEQVIGYPTIMRFHCILIPRLQRPADLPGISNVNVEVVVCKELLTAQIFRSMNPEITISSCLGLDEKPVITLAKRHFD